MFNTVVVANWATAYWGPNRFQVIMVWGGGLWQKSINDYYAFAQPHMEVIKRKGGSWGQ